MCALYEGNLISLIYCANYIHGRARDDVIAIISGAIPRNVGRAKL